MVVRVAVDLEPVMGTRWMGHQFMEVYYALPQVYSGYSCMW